MLRLLLLFISITTIISTVSAQKLKKRTEEYGDFKEVYHIDKATKFRCGESFVVKKQPKIRWQSGVTLMQPEQVSGDLAIVNRAKTI